MYRKPVSIVAALGLIPLGLAIGCGGVSEATDLVDSLVAGIQTTSDDVGQRPQDQQGVQQNGFAGGGMRGMAPGGFEFEGVDQAGLAGAGRSGFGRPDEGGQEPPEDPLGLTDEQRELLREIFGAAHDDIREILEGEREASLAVLTAEQLAILEELGPPPGGHHGPPPHDPNAPVDPNMPPPPPPGGGGGPGGPGHDGPPPPPPHRPGPLMPLLKCVNEPPDDMPERPHPLQRLTEELGLTDEQIAELEAIHADTKTSVEARRDLACEEALDVLTEEQIAILTELDPPPPPPHGGGPGGPGGPGGGGPR